jgi:hypothetical protein
VERCDPPHGFAATWEFGGEVSWIEVRLTATSEGRTRFELEHIAHVDDERWNEYGPGTVGVGWDLTLVGLAMHLSSGRAVHRAASEAWFATDDGKQFLTSSSDAWYEVLLHGSARAGLRVLARPARPSPGNTAGTSAKLAHSSRDGRGAGAQQPTAHGAPLTVQPALGTAPSDRGAASWTCSATSSTTMSANRG